MSNKMITFFISMFFLVIVLFIAVCLNLEIKNQVELLEVKGAMSELKETDIELMEKDKQLERMIDTNLDIVVRGIWE